MNDSSQNTDRDVVDRAVAAVRSDRPSDAAIAGAAERVGEVLERGVPSNETRLMLDTLEDYLAAIPEYVGDRLTPTQRILFEEEARRSPQLRRAIAEATQGESASTRSAPAARRSYRPFAWAAALAALAVTLAILVPELPSPNQNRMAQVERVDGSLYVMDEGQLVAVHPGAWIEGRTEVRTGKASGALLVLEDGSRVEVSERSLLSVTRRLLGSRIDVTRGRIIVAASPQGRGTLDVTTDELMVSVTGTIFGVGHGAMGSLVSVIEGEVEVRRRGESTSLFPGEQLGSRMGMIAPDIQEEIAWSNDADRYIELLRSVAALERGLQAAMATVPRYSTRLVDLVPADAAVYVAVPNAPDKIVEIYDTLRVNMNQTGGIGEAWSGVEAASRERHLEEVIEWLREAADHLGAETVLAMVLQGTGEGTEAVPLVLSEVDAAAFRGSLESQLARLEAAASEGHDVEMGITIIEDPAAAVEGMLSIWLHEDLLIASPSPEVIQAVAATLDTGVNPFVGSDFHTLIIGAYADGAEFLGAVHLAELLDRQAAGDVAWRSDGDFRHGLETVEFLIAERAQQGDLASITAELLFDGPRQGTMAWLAQPTPMAALEFYSTGTSFVTAFVVEDPMVIFDELERLAATRDDRDVAIAGTIFDEELRHEIAASLGGEVAVGLDGPAAPVPGWKAVVEVYDTARLQAAVETGVSRLKTVAPDAGISLTRSDIGDYEGYEIAVDLREDGSVFGTAGMHYAYVDGFLVAGPYAVLVERAIDHYRLGGGLVTASEFGELLPRDGYLGFSALVFNRIGAFVADLVGQVPSNLDEAQREAVRDVVRAAGPSLVSAYARPDALRLVQSGRGGMVPFGFSHLLGLRSLLSGMEADERFDIRLFSHD